MSHYPNVDKLTEASTDAREQAEKALRDAIPPGERVDIQFGPEWVGLYVVQDYPAYSYGHVTVRNAESGLDRRVPYYQVRPHQGDQ